MIIEFPIIIIKNYNLYLISLFNYLINKFLIILKIIILIITLSIMWNMKLENNIEMIKDKIINNK